MRAVIGRSIILSLALFTGCAAFETKPKFFQGQKVSAVAGFHNGFSGKVIDTRYCYTPIPHREYLVEKYMIINREWIAEQDLVETMEK